MHSTRCLDSCQGRKEDEFFLKNDIRPTHKQKKKKRRKRDREYGKTKEKRLQEGHSNNNSRI